MKKAERCERERTVQNVEDFDEMDLDCFYFIGRANKKGLFDLAFFPYKETKKSIDYANHGRTKVEYELR